MRNALLITLAVSSFASAQTFTIDFNNLTPGATLGSQYSGTNGVNFLPNVFSGANSNNTAEPWATNTGLTLSDYIALDPARPGYAVGSPMLFDGNLVRTIADYTNEDGDPSVLTTFNTPITTATVTFIGISFFAAGAFDTQLLALDSSNAILAQAHAVEAASTSQQNLTVSVPTGFSRLAIVPGNYNDVVGFDNLVYTLAAPSVPTWNIDANGSYFNAANWTGNHIPSGPTETARFGNIITQPRTVTLSDSVTLNKVVFDSAVPYTLAGSPNVLSLGGADHELNVVQGSHSIQVRVSSSTGIAKTGAGTVSIQKLMATGNVAVNEGTLSLSGGSAIASKVGSVSVADGAQLLQGTTPLIATGMTPESIRLLLLAGKIGVGDTTSGLKIGFWSGLPYGGGNTVGGEIVSSSDVVIRATLPGDATLDLMVNFDDLLITAMVYGDTNTDWRRADFDYDGDTDFTDLLAVAQHYGAHALTQSQLSRLDADFVSDFRMAMSLVPEPMGLGLVSVAGMMVGRRRK